MRKCFSLIFLVILFISIAVLSSYKNESSSGCSSAPEIIVSKPAENDNIENPPVSIEFTATQNSTDFTSIDLGKVSAKIRDNMNKVIYKFAEVFIYYKFHKDKWLEWWPGGYNPLEDQDDDTVPDYSELENGLSIDPKMGGVVVIDYSDIRFNNLYTYCK